MTLRFTVLLALALTPGIAAAAPAKAKTDVDADAAARKTTTNKTTVYDFENDHVPGELLSPDGANIGGKVQVKWKSLITIRPHFIPQMIHMANDV